MRVWVGPLLLLCVSTANGVAPTRTETFTTTLPTPTATFSETVSMTLPTLTASESITVPTLTASESITLPTLTASATESLTVPTLTSSVSVTVPTATQSETVSQTIPTPTLTSSVSVTVPTATQSETMTQTIPTPTLSDTMTLPTATATMSESLTIRTATISVTSSSTVSMTVPTGTASDTITMSRTVSMTVPTGTASDTVSMSRTVSMTVPTGTASDTITMSRTVSMTVPTGTASETVSMSRTVSMTVPTGTATYTESLTSTVSFTVPTPTETTTQTLSVTQTRTLPTPTETMTASLSITESLTVPTGTSTFTTTPTATVSETVSQTVPTPTATGTDSLTSTVSMTIPTATTSLSSTPTKSSTPSSTLPTPTGSVTPTASVSVTLPTLTATATVSLSATESITMPTGTATLPTLTATFTGTGTPTPSFTIKTLTFTESIPTPSATFTESPTWSMTVGTMTASVSPTRLTRSASGTITLPTLTPSVTLPTLTETISSSVSPTFYVTPTDTHSVTPSHTASQSQTVTATESKTVTLTVPLTPAPTPVPTPAPTPAPTGEVLASASVNLNTVNAARGIYEPLLIQVTNGGAGPSANVEVSISCGYASTNVSCSGASTVHVVQRRNAASDDARCVKSSIGMSCTLTRAMNANEAVTISSVACFVPVNGCGSLTASVNAEVPSGSTVSSSGSWPIEVSNVAIALSPTDRSQHQGPGKPFDLVFTLSNTNRGHVYQPEGVLNIVNGVVLHSEVVYSEVTQDENTAGCSVSDCIAIATIAPGSTATVRLRVAPRFHTSNSFVGDTVSGSFVVSSLVSSVTFVTFSYTPPTGKATIENVTPLLNQLSDMLVALKASDSTAQSRVDATFRFVEAIAVTSALETTITSALRATFTLDAGDVSAILVADRTGKAVMHVSILSVNPNEMRNTLLSAVQQGLVITPGVTLDSAASSVANAAVQITRASVDTVRGEHRMTGTAWSVVMGKAGALQAMKSAVNSYLATAMKIPSDSITVGVSSYTQSAGSLLTWQTAIDSEHSEVAYRTASTLLPGDMTIPPAEDVYTAMYGLKTLAHYVIWVTNAHFAIAAAEQAGPSEAGTSSIQGALGQDIANLLDLDSYRISATLTKNPTNGSQALIQIRCSNEQEAQNAVAKMNQMIGALQLPLMGGWMTQTPSIDIDGSGSVTPVQGTVLFGNLARGSASRGAVGDAIRQDLANAFNQDVKDVVVEYTDGGKVDFHIATSDAAAYLEVDFSRITATNTMRVTGQFASIVIGTASSGLLIAPENTRATVAITTTRQVAPYPGNSISMTVTGTDLDSAGGALWFGPFLLNTTCQSTGLMCTAAMRSSQDVNVEQLDTDRNGVVSSSEIEDGFLKANRWDKRLIDTQGLRTSITATYDTNGDQEITVVEVQQLGLPSVSPVIFPTTGGTGPAPRAQLSLDVSSQYSEGNRIILVGGVVEFILTAVVRWTNGTIPSPVVTGFSVVIEIRRLNTTQVTTMREAHTLQATSTYETRDLIRVRPDASEASLVGTATMTWADYYVEYPVEQFSINGVVIPDCDRTSNCALPVNTNVTRAPPAEIDDSYDWDLHFVAIAYIVWIVLLLIMMFVSGLRPVKWRTLREKGSTSPSDPPHSQAVATHFLTWGHAWLMWVTPEHSGVRHVRLTIAFTCIMLTFFFDAVVVKYWSQDLLVVCGYLGLLLLGSYIVIILCEISFKPPLTRMEYWRKLRPGYFPEEKSKSYHAAEEGEKWEGGDSLARSMQSAGALPMPERPQTVNPLGSLVVTQLRSPDDIDTSEWKEGTQVVGLIRGAWVDGVVMNRYDNDVDVTWEGGGVTHGINLPQGVWCLGDTVEAVFDGEWCPAVVCGKHANGKYDVDWGDGTGTNNVMEHHIRPRVVAPVSPEKSFERSIQTPPSRESAWKAGDRVEALFDESWHPATIMAVNKDGTYNIDWGDGTGTEHVAEIRESTMSGIPIGATVEALFDGEWHPATVYDIAENGSYSVAWGDGQGSSGIPPSEVRPVHNEGDLVQALFNNAWHPAKVISVDVRKDKSRRYNVDWGDGSGTNNMTTSEVMYPHTADPAGVVLSYHEQEAPCDDYTDEKEDWSEVRCWLATGYLTNLCVAGIAAFGTVYHTKDFSRDTYNTYFYAFLIITLCFVIVIEPLRNLLQRYVCSGCSSYLSPSTVVPASSSSRAVPLLLDTFPTMNYS